jgi:hypothetical protein
MPRLVGPRFSEDAKARPIAGIIASSVEIGSETFPSPSAQAFTSCPSRTSRPSRSRTTSTATRLPHTGERFSTVA